MPFTTMNNYNWLFDLDDASFTTATLDMAAQQPLDLAPVVSESFESDQQCRGDNGILQTDNAISRRTPNSFGVPSPRSHAELLSVQSATGPRYPTLEVHPQTKASPTRPKDSQQHCNPHTLPSSKTDDWHSFMGKSSRRPLVLDNASRNRVLDLIVDARPQTPEGSPVTHGHSLLTIDHMQQYCDLFFSHFNKSYPLIHRATFEPSQTEPLLLLSVILLGATYADKDAHRLAVCIHDIMRTLVIQHPAFTATPEIWMLQVILLIECFGKSRAGQKQHDMSHLFHGMLIK